MERNDAQLAAAIAAFRERLGLPERFILHLGTLEPRKNLPLLLLRGAISDLLAMSCVERMQAVSPKMQAVNVPDRGHAPMLDEPVAVAAIDEFLAAIDER